ncbi:MAG: hypothetical protein U0822_17050 [Anaerolineae bacterium]
MTTQTRRQRSTESLTIIPIYEPDPERQLQALRFLLQTRTRRAKELATEEQVQPGGDGTPETEEGESRG